MTLPRILFLPSWWPSPEAPVGGCFIREQALALGSLRPVAALVPTVAEGWRAMWARRGRPASESRADGPVAVFHERGGALTTRWPPLLYHRYLGLARRGLLRVLREWGRPDVIHAHVVLPAGWAATRLGREFGIRVVLSEYTGPFSAHLRTRSERARVREALTWADRVLAVNPSLARELQDVHPAAAPRVIGTLVWTDRFTPGPTRPAASPRRFFALGILLPSKGLDVLLEAVRRLRALPGPPFLLEIGGDGPERPRLEALARGFGLADCCRFLGRLEDDQVVERMRACDAFVSASLGETFGIVLAEALACGKPVIAARSPGPEYVVAPGCGVLVPPGDPDALAEALARPPVVDPLVARASIVSRFGPEAFLPRLLEAYDTP